MDLLSPSPATSTPRPYRDYSKPPYFHYLPSTKTPTSGRKPDDYQPRAQIKQMFQELKLRVAGKKAIKEFCEKYVVSEKLVADYFEHLTDTEMRKGKRRTDNDRKRAERKQQEYNGIDWEDLYHRNQLSSLRVDKLELYITTTILHLKERKMTPEKGRVVKAHIGSKILTSIVQDSQNNIQPASNSNSASNSDSDRVERIVGYRQERTRVLRDNFVPWHNIHVEI